MAGLPHCGVDRGFTLVEQRMPPRRAGGQPLHPIYAQLKTTQNPYLWQPGLEGQPDRLLGYPIETCEQMTNVGAITLSDRVRRFPASVCPGGSHPVTRGTRRCDECWLLHYLRKRVGSCVLDNAAIKFLQAMRVPTLHDSGQEHGARRRPAAKFAQGPRMGTHPIKSLRERAALTQFRC